ncbi:hypothetical protein [Actinomyces oris]|uniref:hypothetical protein n=1 Tax=Actinomyces oris TaxID=544580 RepID=UPI002852D1A2|nr:hypothetical protein [Actinomyces oris]
MTTYTLAGLAVVAILTELALSATLGHHTGVLLLAAALTAATVTHTIRAEKEPRR